MKSLITIVTLLLLMSCNGSNKEPKNQAQPADSIHQGSTKKEGALGKIFIENEKLYSKAFIQDLKAANYPNPIKLIGDNVIVEADTISFPNDLAIQESYVFKGTKEMQDYSLQVKRVNATTIVFDFKLTENNQIIYQERGEASLGALFFLASEVDEDDQSGDAYGASQYDKKDNDQEFVIRVGVGLDENGKKRATVYSTKFKRLSKDLTLRSE